SLLYGRGFPEGVYDAFTFKVIRAKGVENDVKKGEPAFKADDVFTDGGNYSIVVNGLYNGNKFTFKVAKAFDYKFEFMPPVSVTEKAKLYNLIILTDLKDWFAADDSNSFLDPTNSANKTI